MSITVYRMEQDNGFGMFYSEGVNYVDVTPEQCSGYATPHVALRGTPLESLLMPFDSSIAGKGLKTAVTSLDTLFHYFGGVHSGMIPHLVRNGFKIVSLEVEDLAIDKGNEVYYCPTKVLQEKDITFDIVN